MSEHPNVALLRAGYAAFGKGDFAALDDVLAEDVTWHVPGRSQLSGTYEGRPAVYDFFRRTMEVTEGSFRVEPRSILADDTVGFVSVRASAHRGDTSFDVLNAHWCSIRDGRVTEFWEASTDPYAVDELFG